MESIDFLLKYPGIDFYINTLLKPNFFQNGVSDFNPIYNLLVVGGDKEERDTFGRCIPGILQKFLKKQLEQNVEIVERHITCTDKTVTQIKSEIFHHLEKQDLLTHLTDSHVIEILSLYDIHKDMFPILEKLVEELAGQVFLPNKYMIGLIISTLKTGEDILYVPSDFVKMCETYDLSNGGLVPRIVSDPDGDAIDFNSDLQETISIETTLGQKNNLSKNPTTKIKANKNKEFSPLESKLLNFAKKGRPVLLYGIDNYEREGLVKKIHKLNGGIDACWEYVGAVKNIESMDDLRNEIEKVLCEKNYKKVQALLGEYKDTVKTYKLVDFKFVGGGNVLARLEYYEFIGFDVVPGWLIEPHQDDLICPWDKNIISKYDILGTVTANQLDTMPISLIERKGFLFINNIQCKSKDYEWYEKLSIKIEKRRHRDSTSASGNWLVAYTYDYTTFPQQFLDQFELVSLDSEDYEVNEQEEDEETIGTPVRKEELTPFSPSGTKWSDVKMCLIDEDHFKIIIKDRPQKIVTYSQMGFKHKSSTKKNKLWEVLLRFATNNNLPVGYYSKKTEVEKDIQRLNNVLRKHFGITERPIGYHKDKKVYVAEFMISDSSHLKEHMDSRKQTVSQEEILDKEIDNSFS